jgi:hypothetical protein
MTSAWLLLSLSLVAVAWFAIWSRRDTEWRVWSVVAVPYVAAIAWIALTVPLGQPAHDLPEGDHHVLGARIDVDKAIYVLLDMEEPRYFVLPYSHKLAESLQKAMESEDGAVIAAAGDSIEAGDASVREDPPKAQEAPALRIPGPN